MTPFHVGMKVVCVDDESINPTHRFEVFPKKGSVYTIRTICENENGVGLRVDEILNPCAHYSGGFMEIRFKLHRFRPAHENRMDELRTLLAPVPSKAIERVQS